LSWLFAACSSSGSTAPTPDGAAGSGAILDATLESDVAEQGDDASGSPLPDVGDSITCVAGPDGGIGGPPPADCPSDLPDDADCPTNSPRYDDVAPIIATHCTVCHQPGGLETGKLFGSYAQAYSLRREMLTQIYDCRMPPSCALQLTTAERQTMLKWFVCGALGPVESGAAGP
jgi:hypothetical protein